MAYTFLQAVNKTLKRVGIIQGDAGELTTFTDSGRQIDIDVMLDMWNDVISLLYDAADLPGEQTEATFTLASGTGEYTLATDYTKILGNPICEAKNIVLRPYPGSFEDLRQDQPDPSDFTGQPNFWLINPTNDKIRLDSQPDANLAGDVYKYVHEKRINLTTTTDTFPFSDEVVDALQGAVAQAWSSSRKGQFNEGIFNNSLARASGLVIRVPRRTRYGTKASPGVLSDPWPLNADS